MEKNLDILFLEFLEPNEKTNPTYVNIEPFILEHFNKPDPLSNITANNTDHGVIFMIRMITRWDLHFFGDALEVVNRDTFAINGVLYKRWWDTLDKPFTVMISNNAREYLYQFRINNILSITNQSIIDTNKAIKTNIYVQIAIGIITMIAIGLTAVYTIMAYNKDDPKSLRQISKSLQKQEQLLDSIRLLQKEKNTFLMKGAKKNLSKTP